MVRLESFSSSCEGIGHTAYSCCVLASFAPLPATQLQSPRGSFRLGLPALALLCMVAVALSRLRVHSSCLSGPGSDWELLPLLWAAGSQPWVGASPASLQLPGEEERAGHLHQLAALGLLRDERYHRLNLVAPALLGSWQTSLPKGCPSSAWP